MSITLEVVYLYYEVGIFNSINRILQFRINLGGFLWFCPLVMMYICSSTINLVTIKVGDGSRINLGGCSIVFGGSVPS